MHLTLREQERLMIHVAADVARKRQARGLKLNCPEAVALLSAEIMEAARDGRSVVEIMSYGVTLLTTDDVMPGVATMLHEVQMEATFRDGTKLVTLHDPIRVLELAEPPVHPGEYLFDGEDITLNAGRATTSVLVSNLGDRPVQIGSHFHFFEVNASLRFDRHLALGMRLDIPSGMAVRFEPGDVKEVQLVALAGAREVYGHRGLTDGPVDSARREDAR